MKAAATRVVQRLQTSGFTAFFAGGSVRDMLMGREPHDYDVATSARPDQVKALFRRTRMVGAKFGVVLVRMGRHDIEVATFRTDFSYSDGRRPERVVFTTPEEDARRRDFTINGMFYDPIKRVVVDHVGGQADLKAGLIRAIGDPEERFAEDHLRLLRAVRFAARLDFVIEPATWEAIRRHAKEIKRISPERIRMELEAILSHPQRASAIEMLQRAGLLAHLWTGAELLCPHVAQIVRTLAALPERARYELGLAATLLPLPLPQVRRACAALRCSNATQQTVRWLIEKQPGLDKRSSLSLADLKRLMAHDAFADLMDLFAAKLKSQGADSSPHDEIQTRANHIAPEDVAPPPLLGGNDLAELGLPSGPTYKTILDRVYDAQLNEEIHDRGEAIVMARRLIKELQE